MTDAEGDAVDGPEPPTTVLVLALLFGLLGTGLVFLSGLGLTTYYGLSSRIVSLAAASGGEGWRATVFWVLRWTDWLLVGLGLTGMLMLYVALKFYRLRAWARLTLEAAVWSSIVISAAGAVLWYRVVNRLGAVLRSGGRSLSGWGVAYLMTVGLVAAACVLLALLAVLFHLRSAGVRAAVAVEESSDGNSEAREVREEERSR